MREATATLRPWRLRAAIAIVPGPATATSESLGTAILSIAAGPIAATGA
jgi:hypothetical protein